MTTREFLSQHLKNLSREIVIDISSVENIMITVNNPFVNR